MKYALSLVFWLQMGLAGPTQTAAIGGPGKSYLALGDSYTIGESVKKPERFPDQTVALLHAGGVNIAATEYIARTGWTTEDLQDALKNAKLRPPYDIVSLLIGVNDQYHGMDTMGYRQRFIQLLQNAIRLAGQQVKHVFVLSIPDYSVTPFGRGDEKIRIEIDGFNSINRQVALDYHVNYLDITPISRKAATDQSLTANDGLHPSAKQYQEWALLLAAAIQK
jgi:lysophospholipase L1-like esterase